MATPSTRIVDARNLAGRVSELAKWLPCRCLEQSRYSIQDGGVSDQSVTMNWSPSGVDNVRGFGDTKMALLGSSLGALFTGLTRDIRCA